MTQETAASAANSHALIFAGALGSVTGRLSTLAALHNHLVHSEKLHRLAVARLQALSGRLVPFRNFQWKTLPAGGPRTLFLLRHVGQLHRARALTQHALENFQRSRTLILQHHGARQTEEGPATPTTTSPAAANSQTVDAAANPATRAEAPTDPARLTTAEWMRWRANNLRKRT